MTTVTLPRVHWGRLSSAKRALMVHGLGSSAQTCWYAMEALATRGWSGTAVDLRGHGSAPRASRYAITDFAADLEATHPAGASSWDVVIGHSIGAAAAVVASAHKPAWAKALILIDPALQLDDEVRHMVLENQRVGHRGQSAEDVQRLNPGWHPQDCELKVQANQAASLFALEHAVFDNDPWDVTGFAHDVVVPTHVIGGEESLGSMFCGDYAARMLQANEHFSYEVVPGAGHSVHRDKPGDTVTAITKFLEL